MDYYSSFWEVDLPEDTRSATVIRKLKAQFVRHGIPETCVSDNSSQFISDEFKEFSRHWSFTHVTSSPTYPQSNGKVEAAVKSAKSVMKKSRKAKTDPYLALLEYRNMPSQGMENSPVVQLMSRRTRTQVPTLPRLLKSVIDHNVHDKLLTNKERQATNYNKGATDLTELKSGDTVCLIPPRSLSSESIKARVDKSLGTRSYEVVTEDGARYRRNRPHLRKTRESYNRGTLTCNLNLIECFVQQGTSPTASPFKQAERAALAPAVSEQQEAVVPVVPEQQGACRDPSLSSATVSLSQVASQLLCLSTQRQHAQGEL